MPARNNKLIVTGDIAVYSSDTVYGKLIKLRTRGPATHAAYLIRKDDGFLYKRHAALGWAYHKSFIEEPFNLGEPDLLCIVRVKDDIFANPADKNWAVQSTIERSAALLKRTTPYDWTSILRIGLGKIGRIFIRESSRRYMCSEAVSFIWDPVGLPGLKLNDARCSLFHEDPRKTHDLITPNDVLTSPYIEKVWEK